MNLRMYAFFDTKALVYGVPFFMINAATALRAAQEIVTDTNTTIGRHPFDFILHELAIWDDQSGRIEAHLIPVDLGMVGSLLPTRPQLPLMQTAGQE